MKAIAVVGPHGLLGSAFVRILKERGIKVFEITRAVEATSFLYYNEEYEAIINCAGYNHVDNAENPENWSKVIEENVCLPIRLKRMADHRNVPLITFSSDYVKNPTNFYAKSKKMIEDIFMHDPANAPIIIRTAWLFGPDKRCFPNWVYEQCKKGEAFKVVSDQVGQPTYTDDLVRKVLQLLEIDLLSFKKEILNNEILNFVGNESMSWYAFALAIANAAEFPATIIYPTLWDHLKLPAKRPRETVLPIDRRLWHPMSLQANIKRFLEWKENDEAPS